MADDGANVFISHIHEDDVRVGKVKDLLDRHGYAVRDSSITMERPNRAKSPDYIKGKILAPAIDWAGTVLVLISAGMRNSIYVDWEIEFANRQNKNIVGVWAPGATEADKPDSLEKYADCMVDWDGKEIRDAIRRKTDKWQTSDGQERQERSITRVTC